MNVGGALLCGSATRYMVNQAAKDSPATTGDETPAPPTRAAARWSRADTIWLVLLALLAFALWVPRLQGPIDLRYDGGVYYLLGTSIAQGEGYRILNEPGEPVGVQYPPALPTLVAVHQWVLGTDDPVAVGTALRWSFFSISMLYTLLVYVMARYWVAPGWAGLAGLFCALYFGSYYYSDLLFTDIPCALVAVLLVIVCRGRPGPARMAGGAVLAGVGFLLRTAGIALLAAWVGEALLRRQWKVAAIRAALAAVPFVLWQGHVMLTERSAGYQEPAYEYQRADYMFYNVGYAHNARLIDPFQPELGHADNPELARRVGRNLVVMPLALGEAASNPQSLWRVVIELPSSKMGLFKPPRAMTYLPLGLTAAGVFFGLWILVRGGDWLVVLYVGFSIALICLTPWPGQFTRYLTPVTPMLILALVLGLRGGWAWLARKRPGLRRTGRGVIAGLIAMIALGQVGGALYMYKWQLDTTTLHFDGREARTTHFYYDDHWRSMDRVGQWFAEHGRAGDLAAATTPHGLYLQSGIKSIMSPFIDDPAEAQRLLDQAGVTHLVVDEFQFVNIGQRYARPVVEAYPDRWQLVYTAPQNNMWVYQRVQTTSSRGEAQP